ncbi:MAG: ADP-ribosylglycohydrolase family protein [Fimbriimonadaceae bacterium]
MAFRPDYEERVYAGVLGKAIGVYLGRPIEGWSCADVLREFGRIRGYVHHRRGAPLIVADDDISGTFTFLRAIEDHGYAPNLTSERVGETWRNYLIEGKTVLWWGGMGVSTEHTAYLRLSAGIPAPRSGSIALNGRTVAEQIGAQIFIDGWGMVNPGDPERAAAMGEQAARVSHDGEAVLAAKVVAAMVALAFDAPPLEKLLEHSLRVIPADSLIRRIADDVREWRGRTDDWLQAREWLDERYGYHRYGGGCHVVPNHALIWLALVYGGGDFLESQCVVNTCGWDTDCNAGNVGAILGVWGGLEGIQKGADLRGPVADRLLIPTADPGRCVTDALHEACAVAAMARRLHGQIGSPPKAGARWHFSLPGSVQGFQAQAGTGCVGVSNAAGPGGERLLRVDYRFEDSLRSAMATTPVFPEPSQRAGHGYGVSAAPLVVPGQTLRGRVVLGDGPAPVALRLVAGVERPDGSKDFLRGPETRLAERDAAELELRIPPGETLVVESVGLEVAGAPGAEGWVGLDRLAIEGQPHVRYVAEGAGRAHVDQWVLALDALHRWGGFRPVQNRGRGYAITGTRGWTDYRVSSTVVRRLCDGLGFAVRWQGMRRHVLAWWQDGQASIRAVWDGEETVLASAPLDWPIDEAAEVAVAVVGSRLRAAWGGATLEAELPDPAPTEGGVAMAVESGSGVWGPILVEPAQM